MLSGTNNTEFGVVAVNRAYGKLAISSIGTVHIERTDPSTVQLSIDLTEAHGRWQESTATSVSNKTKHTIALTSSNQISMSFELLDNAQVYFLQN